MDMKPWKDMTDEERVRASAIITAKVDSIVCNPPKWAVGKSEYGWAEWSERGQVEWYEAQIHMIEHAIEAHIGGYKCHAYEWEPGFNDSIDWVWIDADGDTCDGGCCDGAYKYRTPWKPYSNSAYC